MKIIELSNGGFIRLDLLGISVHVAGLGFYLGWFSNLDLIGLQVMFMEWVAEDHMTLFRFQVLYFLFALHMDAN